MARESRIERAVGEATTVYEALPSELRASFEAALGNARDALEIARSIPKHVRDAWRDAALMVLGEMVGGGRDKVRAAFKARCPKLWPVIDELIKPSGAGDLPVDL